MTPPEILRTRLAHQIKDFVPESSVDRVVKWIVDYKIKLTITGKRQSIYGDYRNPDRTAGHRISINGDLNKYAFLITLIHEVAHLIVWEHHRNHVRSHGAEWKNVYKNLLAEFLSVKIFPDDISAALENYMYNPAASSCTDVALSKILLRYNAQPVLLVEDLAEGDLFKTADGRIFKRGNKIRTRYRCTEVKSQQIYLFTAVAEVKRTEILYNEEKN